MSPPWQKQEQLDLILYEKTLYLFEAIFDANLPTALAETKPLVYAQLAQVLCHFWRDRDDIRFKMAFATLEREAKGEAAKLISDRVRLYSETAGISVAEVLESGLLRSGRDVREGL